MARLPAGERREDLATLIAALFASGFKKQVVSFDSLFACHYCAIRFARETTGRPIAAGDAMIAATARDQGTAVATRNVDDFQGAAPRSSICGMAGI